MKPELASIVVVTHNRLEYTRLCLDSIIRNTTYPYELIVADNHSTDGTLAYLHQMQRERKVHKVVALPGNYGAGYATNQGIAVAKGDYLVRSDNDMLYTRGWLTALTDALKRIPKAVLQVAVFAELVSPERKGGFSQENCVNGIIINPGPIGGCNMAFTRETFAELGPFPHDMLAEDGVFCFRALQKGYVVGQINDASATHMDDPRCPLSRRYTDYAGYRFEFLEHFRQAGLSFLNEEDRIFFDQYKKSHQRNR